MKHFLFFAISSFTLTNTFAQTDSSGKRTHYYTEAGTYLSTSDTMPFWLRTNQYGIVPNKAPIATFRGGIYHDYDKLRPKKYDWGYGIDAAVNVGAENKFYLPEAYVKVKLNKFEFYAGRRREIIGLVDTTLTSGSYIWSGNALPIPKIQISIPEYLPLKFTKGLLSIKGSYSHGWFDNQGVVKDFYLHQKTFYARIGKPNWKVKMYAGFNHQVQWGGTPTVSVPNAAEAGRAFPSTFKDYIYTITGFSLNNLTPDQQAMFTINDAYNRVGNHLGSIDLGVEINFEKSSLLLYRQNIYETGSLYYLSSVQDGLNGLSWKNKNISTNFSIKEVLVEYLYTKSQGGSLSSDAPISELRGSVNYFNHGQYLNGWSYLSQIIGTAFISPEQNFIPLQNEYIANNRVSLWHLGISGSVYKTNFEAKFSISNNLGTYNAPFNKSQFSSLINAYLPYKNYQLKYSLAFDSGGLYPNSAGLYLGIKRIY